MYQQILLAFMWQEVQCAARKRWETQNGGIQEPKDFEFIQSYVNVSFSGSKYSHNHTAEANHRKYVDKYEHYKDMMT